MQAATGALGTTAPDFALPGTDGKSHRLSDLAGSHGIVIVFMCNHCPYVKAVLDRLIVATGDLAAMGVSIVGISANDAVSHPEDSFERMRDLAAAKRFPFRYLYDESQQVARAYGAVCTPDIFGYDAALTLRYRGRLDSAGRMPAGPDTRSDLIEAMRLVVETGKGPAEQVPSVGCSIKWR